MPEPQCFAPLNLCAMRVAALSSGGAPQPGAFGYRTDAIATASIGLEIEDGEEFTVKNGCGTIAQTVKQPSKVKGSTVTLELTNFDPALLWLLIGNSRRIVDSGGAGSGEIIGWEAPLVSAAAGNGVCLELWSKAWDSTVQATPAFAGGSTAVYFHWVFPKVIFTLSDLPLQEDFTTTTVEGVGSENPNLTANGPWNDWPSDVAGPGGFSGSVGFYYDSTIPTSVCGISTVPATS